MIKKLRSFYFETDKIYKIWLSNINNHTFIRGNIHNLAAYKSNCMDELPKLLLLHIGNTSLPDKILHYLYDKLIFKPMWITYGRIGIVINNKCYPVNIRFSQILDVCIYPPTDTPRNIYSVNSLPTIIKFYEEYLSKSR